MKNKNILLTIATILTFLFIISSASAYIPYPIYEYYPEGENTNMPIVSGPYPREYLWHKDAGEGFRFVHDDFDGYDNFVGYKDLDVFNPDGTIEVIRNPDSTELDLSRIPEGMQTFGNHVYGVLPGCRTYVKHYNHEHPWETGCETGCGVYFTPLLAYKNKPTCTNGCQAKSPCQVRNGC